MLRWLLSLLLLIILAMALFWVYRGSQDSHADVAGDPAPVQAAHHAAPPATSPWEPEAGQRDPQGRSWVRQVGDGWQGGADAPSVGKPSPALDLRWSWQPLADDRGQLTLRLTARSDMAAPLSLTLQPASGASLQGVLSQRRDEPLAAGDSWETSHDLRLGGGAAGITLSYGNQQLQRSLAIVLGEQPARPSAAPKSADIIHDDEVFLVPAR